MKDNFGDRMKAYERQETDRCFLPLLPIYARIDGRGFSRFTKGMQRPYDTDMTQIMISTVKDLVKNTNAIIGYTQSDEISLLWHTESYDSEVFFAGKIQKMNSVLASMTATYFIQNLLKTNLAHYLHRSPHFDCRIFQLPNKQEAANAMLWREQDACKNAISMAASSVYSHKELQGKNGPEKQEMLFQKGINFNDYPVSFKRGTFVRRETYEIMPTEEDMKDIPIQHRPTAPITRSRIVEIDMPVFSKVLNRVGVIFNKEEAIV